MRPIIKIYNLGDGKYEVDIDVFHITREDAYNIMSTFLLEEALRLRCEDEEGIKDRGKD